MYSIILNEKEKLTLFYRKTYGMKALLFISLLMIFAYGIRIVYYNISIDTEVIINDPTALLMSWLSAGRFSLVFLKKLLQLIPFNPYVAAFLMTVINVIIVYFFSFMLWSFSGEKSAFLGKTAICAAFCFITFPIFAEQFSFLLQAFEVSLGIFATMLSVYCLTNWILEKKKTYLVISLFMSIFSFGIYQSNIFLFISITLGSYILLLYKLNKRNELRIGLNYLLFFIISFVFYTLINKIIYYHFFGIGFFNNTQNSYLGSQILWGKVPVRQCLKNILFYFASNVFEKQKFDGWLLGLSFLATLVFIILYFSNQKKVLAKVLFLIACILFLTSPFLLSIFMGNAQAVRTQFSIAVVIAFGLFYVSILIEKKKIISIIYFVLVVLLIITQSLKISNYFYLDYLKYQEECNLAFNLTLKIDALENQENKYPVVFVGTHSFSFSDSLQNYQWETIGRSFFEWDAGTEMGSNLRIHGFLKTLGKDYPLPSLENVAQANSISENMLDDSVQKSDGIIIVKLSKSD